MFFNTMPTRRQRSDIFQVPKKKILYPAKIFFKHERQNKYLCI